MTGRGFDITPFLQQDEGQYFDRKSILHGPPGSKRARDRREVRDQVAEYVAAFANADGGVLVLGIEDDGTVTGHELSEDALQALLNVPRARLIPPQSPGFTVEHEGRQLVVFDVAISDTPVQVTGDGFPLRMGDTTVQSSETKIAKLKHHGLVESWESRASSASVESLDADLIQRAKRGAGLTALSDDEYLLKRRLADRRGSGLVLRRAAELVFAQGGPDHPNAGVRLFRVVGRERRFGAEHNVEERPRIEGNLPDVVRETFQTVNTLLRRPARLVGSRFQPGPEYPDFSWREAILNAIAHRDYGEEGRTTEVWLFEDRMEVVSPGRLIEGITVEELARQQRVHSSRNPRLVRVLVDLGYMRDQGEGIPRMFAEMESSFLPEPLLEVRAGSFAVTLQNTPTLTTTDHRFVANLGELDLAPIEFRALYEAHRHGRVDNSRMRVVAGLETLSASQVLRTLRDRGLLELHAHGSASYYTLSRLLAPASPERRGTDPGDLGTDPGDLHADLGDLRSEPAADLGDLHADPGDLPSDLGDLHPDLEDLHPDLGDLTTPDLPPAVVQRIRSLGKRPRHARLRPVIIDILRAAGALTAPQLAALLGRRKVDHFVTALLTPMVADRELERTHPDNTHHPQQAYRVPGTSKTP